MPAVELVALLASVRREPPFLMSTPELNIKVHPYVVAQGWFNFPFNFDPRWLENCDGFEQE